LCDARRPEDREGWNYPLRRHPPARQHRRRHRIRQQSFGRRTAAPAMTAPTSPCIRPVAARTRTFDGTSWTELSVATSPPARANEAMAPLGNVLVLFGGSSGPTGTRLKDTWTFDGSSWTQVTTAVSPPACAGASLATLLCTASCPTSGGGDAGGDGGTSFGPRPALSSRRGATASASPRSSHPESCIPALSLTVTRAGLPCFARGGPDRPRRCPRTHRTRAY